MSDQAASEWFAVCSLQEVGNDFRPIDADGKKLMVYRWQDAIYVTSRVCPHAASDLSEGILSRGSIVCARHGWRFDAKTGACEGDPTIGVKVYVTQIHEGWVFARA